MKKLLFVSLLAACGNSTPAKTDSKVDTKPVDTASGPMLTVKNYLSWCSVSVAGGTASSLAVQTKAITAAGQISLVASPLTGFTLATDMWHHTDGDTGSGEAGMVSGNMSTATVTVQTTASKCVWVCCPGGSIEPCPTADQCP